MMRQFRSIVVISALAAISAACSANTSAVPSPASPRQVQDLMPGGGTVHYSIFRDLPGNPSGYPWAIAADPKGSLWVADDVDQDAGPSLIARIDPDGHRTAAYYFNSQVLPSFESLVVGPDRNVWIADGGDYLILKMTPSGTFTQYALPNSDSPMGICVGPDGALWFSANGLRYGVIGRITAGGDLTIFKHGISDTTQLNGIAAGPDGALWFTESNKDSIGRITTSGRVTTFSKGITHGSYPLNIAAGSDGALWFTESSGGAVAKITTKGAVTEYRHGVESENPFAIAPGPGGMWFTVIGKTQQSRIGTISADGKMTFYPNLPAGANPYGIVKGPDAKMWFVEQGLNSVGRVDL